jgi:hypothetical protein
MRSIPDELHWRVDAARTEGKTSIAKESPSSSRHWRCTTSIGASEMRSLLPQHGDRIIHSVTRFSTCWTMR